MEPMKKLGEGWQYTVYDLGNGRVLKRFNSPLRSFWVIAKKIFPFTRQSLFKVPGFIPRLRTKAEKSFRIVQESNIPASYFANVTFLPNLAYEQDKVDILVDLFAASSLEDSKKLVDRFIDFSLELKEKGVIDKFLNISKNFGIDAKGNMVLIDIGELLNKPEDIANQITDRVWASKSHSDRIKDLALRQYFVDQMDLRFK